MIEKGILLLVNLVLGICMFSFGMLGLFIGLYWLIEFLSAASTWANTGTWPPLTLLQFMQKFSVPVPHTEMVGIQNIIDWWLAQSAIVWVFILAMGCAGISNWLGELMIPMASEKA